MSVMAETAILSSSIGFNVSGVIDQFWQLTIEGLSYGSIYALVAVGYTLVYGVLRLINFAHSEIFMLGMFGQYIGLQLLGFGPSADVYSQGTVLTIVYLAVAMAVGMLFAGGAAVGLERVAYRPLRKRGAKPLIFLITAIGMSFVLQEFVHFVLPKNTLLCLTIALAVLVGVGIWVALGRWASGRLQLPVVKSLIVLVLGIGAALAIEQVLYAALPKDLVLGGSTAEEPIRLVEPTELFHISTGVVTNIAVIIVVSALLLALVTDLLINRTKFGRGIRAVAQDPNTATLMGVSRERVIMLTFLIGGVLAGAAALLYTLKIPSGIIYSGGFILGIKAFSAAVLGGIGNLRGALLGGLLLGLIENYGQVLFGAQWRDVIAFVLLVLVLMIRPTGILGESLGKARV
ncbi:branched-chain amino acid ABC transporter permease [Antrihabitans sp. YC2-6]|uniref:branched-chain amino acid ABC transporter permease n=1 Tax=Antrihabitans sp. YC2-6 TaxID=2799498 RepID=UPI0018F71521|nr:branched-chain amino acid ABC transporter permease [Antrihabitans sp. YC2-6]MBJ8343104.1 branched-chain amino acid ABC transporter permease [Antrihabitans sp. YC2-6]